MELLDFDGNKYKVVLDRNISNYYEKITNFINNPQLYSDYDLVKILTLNYYNDGIYCSSLIKNNDPLRNSNQIFYKNLDIINDFRNIKIMNPYDFLNDINIYITKIDNNITYLESKHSNILEYDIKIVNILSSKRQSNYFDYLNNLLDLNNIRLMINRIFFEYTQDLINYSNRLKQIKYDFFVTENNIKSLLISYYTLTQNLDIIFKEDLFLLTNNNSNKFNIKENNGSIKYDKFINIIENRIENI